MIGTGYWATGITVDYHDGAWRGHVDFYDDGFVGDDDVDAARLATEGKIRSRYSVKSSECADALTVIVDVLKADAERLGITWRATAGGPYIYAGFESAADHYPNRYPSDWRRALTNQARRLGWDSLYARATAQ